MINVLGALPAILKLLDADSGAVEQLVFVAWRRTVDGAMTENVTPVRMDGKRLIAAVPNETWRRQVADLGPALAAKMNALLGTPYVSFIEFRVDDSAVAANRSRIRHEGAMKNDAGNAAEITPELKAAANAISDDSLRSIFLAAAASCLAHNERIER